MICTLFDPACRHTRARQLMCARQLRRAGKLAISGYTPPRSTDVQATWRKAGWTPTGRVAFVSIEYRNAA